MKRSEVDIKYTWDLSKFCKNDKTWYAEFEKLTSYSNQFLKFKGKLNNPNKLFEYFNLNKECDLLTMRLYMYASNNLNIDLSNKTYNQMYTQLTTQLTKLEEETSFSEPELLSYSIDYFKELEKDERFKNYRFFFKELLREKKHVLTEKEEKLLSGVGNFAHDTSDIFDSLTDVDFKFEDAIDCNGKPHAVTNATYLNLLKSSDRTLRQNAFISYYKKYQEFNNTISQNYISNLKSDLFFAKARNYNGVLQSALYSGNINVELFKKLNEMVVSNLNLVSKYYDLRKKALEYDELHFYDLNVSICKEFDKKFSFDEAKQIVINALIPLGEKYLDVVKNAFESRWIDVYATENKRSGGYQSDMYGITPIILLNYNNEIDEVFTVAHEMGHAMHSYLSSQTQPYETHSYTIFLAEIASTFNEVLLLKYLYKNATQNEEKLFYLDRYLNLFNGTIFRQMQYSSFEEFAHGLVENNLPISKEILNDKYKELNAKFNKNVVNDELKSYHWSLVPHFYRSFYVYKYATGLISAIALATKVLNNEQGALNKYFKFLSSGGSDYSTSILKRAGVDLTQDEPYQIAFGEMKWALKEMEKLINNR